MERYEFSEGSSDKFWEVAVQGCELIVQYGRIGTQGQRKDKTFTSTDLAEKEKAKLVKEKTGKGYKLVGNSGSVPASAPVTAPVKAKAQPVAPASAPAKAEVASPVIAEPVAAPAPVKAAPLPLVPDDGTRLVQGTPLPTRTRPGPASDKTPAQAWASVQERVRTRLDPAQGGVSPAHRGALESMLETPLAGVPAEQAARWVRVLAESFAPGMGFSNRDRYGSYKALVNDFVLALIDGRNADYLIRLLVALEDKSDKSNRNHYVASSWGVAVCPALRAALVRAPEEAYQAVLDWALSASAAQKNPQRDALWSFILADDRAGQTHALQALQVLQTAVENGVDVGDEVCFVPLLAECPRGADPSWFKRRNYLFYFSYSWVDSADIAATVSAVAQAQGVSPAPVLDWLLYYATEHDRTVLACALLDTRESEALSIVLAMSHDKWVRAALDQALDVHPRWLFRELLAGYSPGRSEPTIKTRLMKLSQRFERATLNEWIADLGERCQQSLEKLLASEARLATHDELPRVLKAPPWRKTKGKVRTDLVLELRPVETSFVFEMPEEARKALVLAERERVWSRVKQITTVPAVLAKVSEEEASLTKRNNRPIPAFETPLPVRTASETDVGEWVAKRATQLLKAGFADYRHPYNDLIGAMPVLPDEIAMRLWQQTDFMRSSYARADEEVMLARFGERALPGFLGILAADPISALAAAQAADTSTIAPFAARAFLQLKKARADALSWLKKHPRAAAFGLIPDAVGKPGAQRDAAEHGLRWLCANVPQMQAAVDEAVAAYAVQNAQVAEAVQQVLARDPLDQVPSKVAKLPGWFVSASMSRPLLKNGAALPDEAMNALGEMLSFCNSESLYAGIAQLRESCDAESLANFAWDQFSIWLTEGAPGKENWALRALGWLGSDDTARRLTPMIRKWPGEAAHARAVTGLEVLADIGSDVALMHLNGIAEKLKFKGLQEKAREKIAALAEARDLTPEELADRLVPDFDLDERGGLDLDFGPRRFRVGFDEFLKPWVKDEGGVRLKDLPKPNKADDPERAAEASARWSALKKDARAVASLQLARLETLLASGRRIKPAVFDTFFARHPLIRHLAQRLLWGVYADATTPAAPERLFRITEDLVCADVNDEAVQIDFSEEASTAIGLVHPLHLSAEDKAAWGTLFGDYEIAQPFAQLGRDTYALTPEELPLEALKRFAGAKVESKRMRGITARGWRLGDPQDGGGIWWVQRKVCLASGKQVLAILEFSDGLIVGGMDFEDEFQTLGDLTLSDSDGYWSRTSKYKFAELDVVMASEILRDLTQLVDAAKT